VRVLLEAVLLEGVLLEGHLLEAEQLQVLVLSLPSNGPATTALLSSPLPVYPKPGDKTTTVSIANVGRDGHLSIEQGNWVEVVDEDYVLQGRADPLLRVSKVDTSDPLNIQLTLDGVLAYDVTMERYPIVRRWDQKARQTKRDGEPDPVRSCYWYNTDCGRVWRGKGRDQRTLDHFGRWCSNTVPVE